MFPAGEHVGEGERLQTCMDQVRLRWLLSIFICCSKPKTLVSFEYRKAVKAGFTKTKAQLQMAGPQVCGYLDSTAAQSPWHFSCPRPSEYELSQCSQCPEATSPATDTPHGGCLPGTALKIRQKWAGNN